MSDAPGLLTHSRLRSFRSCPRLHHLTYGLGYRPAVEDENLRFGSGMHLGHNAWWGSWRLPPDERLNAALLAVRALKDPFELVRAEELLRGYHMRWVDVRHEVLGVEVPFECELRNPTTGKPSRTWRLAGKIDLIVRDPESGRVLIGEFKTATGDIGQGSEYWKRLRLDGQVSLYFEGAKSLGHDVAGCLYDVMGKPAQRPLLATPFEARKFTKQGAPYANTRLEDETPEEYRARIVETIAESPEKFFQRGELVRLESEMSEAIWDVWTLGQTMREGELAGRAPRNPESCTKWGRVCSFFPACTGEGSLDDPSLFRRITEIHPELSDAPNN